ncbi:hypothetical protein PybrP1_000356 [[Pythium] brassicae (nom. inval.)]|nr:hypothetical protein PybrP1_000356 [[Pythium] brassicae (nom. inval.)]
MSAPFAFATLSPSTSVAQPDAAVLERRRKQRDLKRRFRARKKGDVEAMKLEVQELEDQYERLCSITTGAADDARGVSLSTTPGSAAAGAGLRGKYTQARDEAAALRAQIAAMKERLVEFDRFESAVKTYAGEFAAPTHAESLLREPPDPFEPLSEEVCFAIIQQCYQQIFFPQWRGTRVSTGAQLFGWRDERFVDGTTLRFALTKSFEHLAIEHMMAQTWNIVTREEHKHTIQKTTIGVKTLQVINDDVLVTQRCVHHSQLHKVTCVNMLMFRLRTERGYVVAYVTIDHPSPPTSPSAAATGLRSNSSSSGSSRSRSTGAAGGGNGGGSRATFVDIDEFTSEQRGAGASGSASGSGGKASVSWVDTLQWFIFEDALAAPPPLQAASPPVYEVTSPYNSGSVEATCGPLDADDAEMDDLMGFAASLMDQPSPRSAAASSPTFTAHDEVAGSGGGTSTSGSGSFPTPGSAYPASPSPAPSALPPPSPSAVNVTFGGRMDNKDLHYVSYFLVEVVSMIVRWDQAVAYSRLPFSVDATEPDSAASSPAQSPAPPPFAFVVGRDTSEDCGGAAT